MTNRAGPAKVALLFGLSCLLWLAFALFYGKTIATSLLPLCRWEIAQLAPQYEIADLGVARAGTEEVIKAGVKTAYPRIFGDRSVPAGVPMESSTLLGNMLQPLVLMLSLISAAALLQGKHALALLILAAPSAAAVVMLDAPLVLVGALEDLVSSTMSPSGAIWSPWVIWMDFLNGGGRLALAICAALAVIAVAPLLTAFLGKVFSSSKAAYKTSARS